jgi:hypothetical protein
LCFQTVPGVGSPADVGLGPRPIHQVRVMQLGRITSDMMLR